MCSLSLCTRKARDGKIFDMGARRGTRHKLPDRKLPLWSLQVNPRRSAAPEGAFALSGCKFDVNHVKYHGVGIKRCHNLHILLIEFLSSFLIVQEEALSSLWIGQ